MNLHVAESGQENAETIVFLHGGGVAGWMWRPQVEALEHDYHVLVPDLPGSGASPGPFRNETAAEQIAELIEGRAHGGRAHVVGLSEGAQVLLVLLARRPDVVERAIVSSALVRPVLGGRMQSEALIRWTYRTTVAPFRNVGWYVRFNMRYSAGAPAAFFDDFAESFRALSEDHFVDVLLENQCFRLPAGLDRVPAPTLVVCGAREVRAMRESVRDIAAALPMGTAYEVRHRRRHSTAEEHNWSLSEPELFTRMVRAWIEEGELPEELLPVRDGSLARELGPQARRPA